MDECVRFAEESPVPPPESLYEDVYVRSPYINMKAAEKDPAWKAAVREDGCRPAAAHRGGDPITPVAGRIPAGNQGDSDPPVAAKVEG